MTNGPALSGVAVLVVLIVVAPALVAGGAGDAERAAPPETADEYLETFQTMSGTEAYEEYAEFETIRETAVSTVQVGTFDEETETEASLVYELLIAFEDAYDHAQAGDDEAALTAAERAANRTQKLQERGTSYAVLADLALDRFFAERAEQLFEEAATTDGQTTEWRLERLELASRAVQGSGQTDGQNADRIISLAGELATELERDRQQINDTMAGATAFVERCDECTSAGGSLGTAGIGVFSSYAAALGHAADLRTAEERAAEHGLDEQQSEIEAALDAVEKRQWSLATASILLLGGFVLAFGTIATLVTARIARWRDDALEAQQGNDVFAEEIRDA